MGTDIHSIIQYRAGGHRWSTAKGRPCDDRNYDTFAILANVRNGYGFAGCETGEEWPIIAEPRGIPSDMHEGDYPQIPDPENPHIDCPTCYTEKGLWLGDHSHSWVTLREMKEMAQKLEQKSRYMEVGCVSVEEYEKFVKDGLAPDSWSGGISGPNINLLDVRQLNNKTPEALKALGATHVRFSWPRPIGACIPSFYRYIEEMEKVKREYDYGDHHRPTDDDVRLVFGFDS